MTQLRELTAQEWEVAETIAYELAQAQQGFNLRRGKKGDKGLLTEFKKVLSYCQSLGQGTNLWVYLEIWQKKGKDFGHGGNIEEYYQKIASILKQNLKPYQDDRALLLQLLGWSSRLAAYQSATQGQRGQQRYQDAAPRLSQSSQPSQAAQKTDEKKELRKKLEAQGQDVSVGALLQAKVVEKKPNKKKEVTYEIEGVEFTEPEKKRFDTIPDSGLVWVEIKDVELKHVKFKKMSD